MIKPLAFATAFAGAILAAACAPFGRAPAADIAVYDLGAPPPAAAAPAGVALEVRLPAWLDGQAMCYRLDYADGQRLRSYALARWAASPAALLQQRLRQQLGATPAGTGAPCTLRVELDDFSQSYASATSSRVALRGDALLFGKGRVLLARQSIAIDQPTASADAAGGAHALAAAAGTLAGNLSTWLREQGSADCRPR
jgi:cholesterol transport system auxiliary component